MALITPERLVALKANVKAECQRRKYTGSVSSYGDTAYDFTVTPSTGKMILKEHYEKIATPLNAITGDIDTNGARIISEDEISAMESKVENLKKKSLTASKANSGCAASCTGLCATSCTGSCSGSCDGSCDGDCEGCTGTCSGSCDGSCIDSCARGCSNDCSGYCTGCSGGCIEVCADSCNGTCVGGCDTSCENSTSSIHSKGSDVATGYGISGISGHAN